MDKFTPEPEKKRTMNGKERKCCWWWNRRNSTAEENATEYIVSGLADLDFSRNNAGK